MTIRVALVAFATVAVSIPAAVLPALAAPAVVLAPHRAVYELKLSQSRGSGPSSIRGRILYDFSGNACEGYALQFRQVSELDGGEGKSALSDLRMTSWEEGDGKSLRFNSQSYMNEKLTESVEGLAKKEKSALSVALTKPQNAKFDLKADFVFPSDHVRRIITAAREGQTVLEVPVYDGADTGRKSFNSLTVIGKAIPPEKKPQDAAGQTDALAGLTRWPITVSYFARNDAPAAKDSAKDKDKDDNSKNSGEQTPAYAISFEVYENGISRALTLDYNDFVLIGEMSKLEMKPVTACR